jgi:hypothetical protein
MRCWEDIVCGGQQDTVAWGGYWRISDDKPSAISSINRSSISGHGTDSAGEERRGRIVE